MKSKKYLVLGIISLVLGAGSFGIVLLFGLFGGLVCGKPFHIINGSNGPIPACTSIFNTDFVWFFICGISLIVIGTILLLLNKKKKKENN